METKQQHQKHKNNSYFNFDDNVNMYLEEMQKYETLTEDENIKLVKEYQRGNHSVINKIIEGNLRLVVAIAATFNYRSSAMSVLDLIQEGNLVLFKVVEKFDTTRSNFGAYASVCIRNHLRRKMLNEGTILKTPEYLATLYKKYDMLITHYVWMHHEIPSDEYIMENLGITHEVLNTLKNKKNREPLSIEYQNGQDSKNKNKNKNENMGIVLQDPINVQAQAIEKVQEHDLLAVLKDILTPKKYFILYYRVLSNPTKILEDISEELGISIEAVRKQEAKIFKEIKPFFANKLVIYEDRLLQLRKKHANRYYKLNVSPTTPNDICMFLFVKDKLSQEEKKMLYLQKFGTYCYTSHEICKLMNCSLQTYDAYNFHIDQVIYQALQNEKEWGKFKKEMLATHGSKIYEIELLEEKGMEKCKRLHP